MISIARLHLLSMSFLFLTCTLLWFYVLLLAIGAFCFGLHWCQIVLAMAVVEVVVEFLFFPLRPGPGVHGYWPAWCAITECSSGAKEYFQSEIIVEGDELDGKDSPYKRKDKNYMLCYIPHSLYAIGLWEIRRYFLDKHGMIMLFTGADIIFRVPLLRRIMTWWGCTEVSASVLKANLQRKYPYNLLMHQPDGIAGMFYGLEQEQIVLNRRRGFVRVALQTGASLIPCYALGANNLFNRRWGSNSLAARLSHRCRASFVYWTGRYEVPFGFIPNPTKLVFAIGKPIDVEQVDDPTQEQIDELHQQFVRALRELFDRHAHRMGEEWTKRHDRLYLESENLPPASSTSHDAHKQKKLD